MAQRRKKASSKPRSQSPRQTVEAREPALRNLTLAQEKKALEEQQAATAHILRALARSTTDPQPVFEVIVEHAHRLTGAVYSVLYRYDGEKITIAADRYANPAASRAQRASYPRSPSRDYLVGCTILEGRTMHSPDLPNDPRFPGSRYAVAKHMQRRALLGVPLLRHGAVIGAIATGRAEARPFTKREIKLLETFADQAVMAIDKVALLSETKEALEQQTATSEILGVISRSPNDLTPVFDAILRSALQLCEAHLGHLHLYDGETYRTVAQRGATAEFAKYISEREPYKSQGGSLSRATAERRPVHVPDLKTSPGYLAGVPGAVKFVELGGARTALYVPLLKDDKVLGVLVIYRPEVRPFTEKQIALVSLFANQAVIAMENTRLFNETKEALERQTATAEILGVISGSPTDLQPVFKTILASATRLCDAHLALLNLYDGDAFRTVAHQGGTPEFLKWVYERGPFKAHPLTRLAGLTRAQEPYGTADLTETPAYQAGDVNTVNFVKLGGARSYVVVPLVKDAKLVGAIAVYRSEVKPFTEKHVQLVKTFADQAVIAIENVRLFNELKTTNTSLSESLEQQTATAEILRVISSSPTDVQPVFNAIARSAVTLCGGMFGAVFRYDGEKAHFAAHYGFSAEALELMQHRFPRIPQGLVAPPLLEATVSHCPDVLHDPRTANPELHRALGDRAFLGVPMLLDGRPIGAICVFRREPGPFADAQIAVLQTFADQAVIAIENVRLFNETKEALERQTATGEILASMSGSMTDTKPVFDAIVRNLLRLFGTSYAVVALRRGDVFELGGFKGEPGFERLEELYPLPVDEHTIIGEVVMARHVKNHAPVVGNSAVPRRTAAFAQQFGFNSIIAAPMMWKGEAIGVIMTARRQPLPFDDKQVALIQSFADQAVIAIENVRLFNELQATNSTLREALGQQTATGEILNVISRSTTDVQPVFDTIIRNAVRLCDGAVGAMFRYDGSMVHVAALYNQAHGVEELFRKAYPQPLSRENPGAQAILDRGLVSLEDVEATDYSEGAKERARGAGYRGVVAVPLMREGIPIGSIAVGRRTPGKFPDSYVELLKTFADQAVIAIENVRLFKELQERTKALTKSVDQLTALGEVGQAISSTLELETVLKTVVSRAVQLTGLDAGAIYEYDAATEQFHLRAAENMPETIVEVLHSKPIRKGEGAVGGTAVAREPIQVPDTQNESYKGRLRDLVIRTGRRALLAVPLMHEEDIVGALAVHRNTPGPFAQEVVDLLKTFATQSALAIQNAKLFREIQEKSAQLEVVNRQLEVANKHKSDFLANMSHELRTPLNAIIGFSEAMIERMFGDLNDKQLEYQKDILESGKHLLSLINDILDLSKIEAGHMELELSNFHLPTAVSNAVILVRERAMRHGIALGVDIDQRLGEFQADERKVKQILLNLLSNAVKFTPDGGRVDVSAKLDSDKVEIAVKDTGVGIAPEDQASLFEEFKQLGKDSSRKAEGTGLGLALTKRLVELHGGEIRVDSAVGHGSTFRVILPSATLDHHQAPPCSP